MSRKQVALGAALVLLAVSGGLVLLGTSDVGLRARYDSLAMIAWPTRFSSEQWQSHPSHRWKMADDLAHQTILRGRSRAELLRLLGAPTSSRSESEYLAWATPSPERPDDRLVIQIHNNVVQGWYFGPDPEVGMQSN